MIADLQQKKARAATTVDGRPPGEYFDENLAAGRAAFASHDYAAAKRSFENAMRVKPLPPDVKAAYDTAAQQVAKLATAQSLFAERRYGEVISSLQPLRAQDPQNMNIRRMIVDAHGERLWAENNKDGGAIFRFTLKPAGLAPADGHAPHGRGRTDVRPALGRRAADAQFRCHLSR